MFSIVDILAAFGGGLLGSAMGALPAFIFTGLLVIANLTDLAFGPVFGPHVSFAGAVAATAFAAKRGLDSGMDILAPLIKLNDGMVLLVGGLFGAAGLIIQQFLASLKVPTDTVALTVLILGILARFIFGNRQLFHKYTAPDGKTAGALIMLGLGVGLMAGQVAITTKNPVFMFGVAAFILVVLQFMGAGPVFHHLALPAALAAAAAGSIWMGGLFGILGALLGDVFAKVLNAGDTHIDPPAATIALLTTLVLILL